MKMSKIVLAKVLLILVIAISIFSCQTTNNVVADKSIQKRKYNKGYYFANKFRHKSKIEIKNSASESDKASVDSKRVDVQLFAGNYNSKDNELMVSCKNEFTTEVLFESEVENQNIINSPEFGQSIKPNLEVVKRIEAPYSSPKPPKKKNNVSAHDRAKRALIFGILAAIPYVGLVFSILALRNAVRALKKCNSSRDKVFAIIGLILSIFGMMWGTFSLFLGVIQVLSWVYFY